MLDANANETKNAKETTPKTSSKIKSKLETFGVVFTSNSKYTKESMTWILKRSISFVDIKVDEKWVYCIRAKADRQTSQRHMIMNDDEFNSLKISQNENIISQ